MKLLVAASSLLALAACVPDGAFTNPINAPPLCTAHLSIAGHLENSPPRPTDCGHLGMEECDPKSCWPLGVWRFTASLDENTNTCAEPPILEREYAFEVTQDDKGVERYAYLTRPTLEAVNIKVSSGGGGLCQATVAIYDDRGRDMLTLKPALQAGDNIDGFGDFDRFGHRQLDDNPEL